MKKRLFLGILALAAVAVSCSKDVVVNEVPQDQPIEFGTYLGRDAQTKGSVTNSTNLKNVGFGVYSYYTTTSQTLDSYFGNSGTATSEEKQFKPNFMNNQQVSWDTDWDYTPKKYWPKRNDNYHLLSFFAYAPFDNDGSKYITHDYTSSGKFGQPLLTYTIPPEVSNHQDILFAPISQNKEITKETNPYKLTEEGTVKFHFFHALSRIGFAVKAAAEYTGTTITVNSITLTGKIKNSGTMNLYTATANTETGTQGQPGYEAASNTPGWELTEQNNDISYELSGLTITANNSAFTSVGTDYIMIFPQSFDASALTIEVNYTVTYSTPAQVSIDNIVSVKNTGAISFAPGKAYTFNLIIGLDAINFTADVEDWPAEETIATN